MEGGKVWLSLELKFERVFFLKSDIHEIQESSFSLLFPKKAAVYLEDMSNQNFFQMPELHSIRRSSPRKDV